MVAQRVLTAPDDSAAGWQRALYAFLAEKERRSGSPCFCPTIRHDANIVPVLSEIPKN